MDQAPRLDLCSTLRRLKSNIAPPSFSSDQLPGQLKDRHLVTPPHQTIILCFSRENVNGADHGLAVGIDDGRVFRCHGGHFPACTTANRLERRSRTELSGDGDGDMLYERQHRQTQLRKTHVLRRQTHFINQVKDVAGPPSSRRFQKSPSKAT